MARETLETGLAIGAALDSEDIRETCHRRLGDVATRRGKLDEAEEHYQESLAIEREVGDRHGEAKSLNNLGSLAVEAGDHETARQRLTEAFELYESVGKTERAVETAESLAWLASEAENHDEALGWCERGLELIEASQSELSDATDRLRTRKDELEASDHPNLGSLYRTALRATASGETDEATRLFREGWERREEVAPDSEAFQLALSAGVGLLGELRLLDIEETADAEETIASEIASDRDRLTEPAEALFGELDDESARRSHRYATGRRNRNDEGTRSDGVRKTARQAGRARNAPSTRTRLGGLPCRDRTARTATTVGP